MIPELLENAIGYNIYRVSLLFRRKLIRALSEYHLTPEQWQVMVTLWSINKPLNQTDIVTLTLKDKPTVSRMLKRLENNGYIIKRISTTDSRATEIIPTESGRSIKDEVINKLMTDFQNVYEGITTEEHDELLRVLKKLRTIINDTD